MRYDKMKLAEMVKSGRTAIGYTQAELSEVTQISLRSIQLIENAEVEPRLYTIKVLAAKLEFDHELAVRKEAPAMTAPPLSIKKISLMMLSFDKPFVARISARMSHQLIKITIFLKKNNLH